MLKTNNITIFVLGILTLSVAWIARSHHAFEWTLLTIMILSVVKILLISFQFMELRHAHPLWKFLLASFMIAFLAVLLVLIKLA